MARHFQEINSHKDSKVSQNLKYVNYLEVIADNLTVKISSTRSLHTSTQVSCNFYSEVTEDLIVVIREIHLLLVCNFTLQILS